MPLPDELFGQPGNHSLRSAIQLGGTASARGATSAIRICYPFNFAVEGASTGGYQNYFCESGWMKPVAFHLSTLNNRQQFGTEHFFYRPQFLPLVRY